MNQCNGAIKITKASLAEFIGTFFLVFVGCGAVTANQLFNGAVGHLGVSLAFGLVIMVMIYAVGHISGAHFNPAVTISFTFNRHFPLKLVTPYILSQYLGAIAAAYVLFLTYNPMLQAQKPGAVLNLGVTQPANDSLITGIIWEFLLTFILMFVITAVATDTRAVGSAAGMSIGGTVCLCALFAGPITGASMNPARSLGPALVTGQWEFFLVYLIPPILGAVLAGYTYNFLCCHVITSKKMFEIE
ncbi:MAG: MIP family channel protein [Candidatus Aminicenantes bacterium]|nr:MAG: MIP family channel protein [Candidatus Aminicenantes bacterium]